jgi:methyltransferase-like protein/trans-aconitate methyltransferase
MSTIPLTSYDAVSYPGAPFAQTHPDRLATLATLYGLTPALPGKCRVLELGCGDGGNLVPMAYSLRESEFLGIDLALTAVEKGRETIAALGLSNISLVAADLSSVSGLGTFDYVIAHGLYSWVPEDARERILALAAEVLAPHGVAYISYNAYPGCHARNAVRQMMRWHVRDQEAPAKRIEQARALIRLLADPAPENPVLSAILKETQERQERQDDAVLFHDDLAEINEPFLFIDFVERAELHGLKFLAEADYPDMVVWSPESPAGRFLNALGKDILLQQQYRDFLVFRRFRQTILCRADAPSLREPDAETVRRLFVAASTRPQPAEASVASEEPVRFTTGDGRELKTPHPFSKAAFLVLGGEWPRWIPVEELLACARTRLAEAGGPSLQDEDERRLLGFLLRGWGADVVQLRSRPCPFVTTPSELPCASAMARLQAEKGEWVTNHRHETVRLEDPLVRRLLTLLDGTRDSRAIEEEMARFIREKAEPEADALLAALPVGVERNLDRVAKLALLET